MCLTGGDVVDKPWNMHLMEMHAAIKKRQRLIHMS